MISEGLRSVAGDSGVPGNYDVDKFVENTLRTLETLDVQFTPDSIVVSRGQQTKRVAYAVVDHADNALVLQTAGKTALMPPGPMQIHFLSADALRVDSPAEQSVALFLRRSAENGAQGASPPG